MKTKYIIMGLVIILVVLFLTQKKEHGSGGIGADTGNADINTNKIEAREATAYATESRMVSKSESQALQALAGRYIIECAAQSSQTNIPKGGIIIWSGDVAPEGWALCDGTNGTPDLQGRFVLGYGQGNGLTGRPLRMTGGVEIVTLTEAQMPSHNHSITGMSSVGRPDGGEDWGENRRGFTAGKGYGYYVNSCDRDSTRRTCNSLTTPTNMTGNNTPHENMPPFYVLAYIMKL